MYFIEWLRHMVGGPTNSGKTYHALKRLEEADPSKGGGLYCGPLWLLALEVYEQLNRNGTITTLPIANITLYWITRIDSCVYYIL